MSGTAWTTAGDTIIIMGTGLLLINAPCWVSTHTNYTKYSLFTVGGGVQQGLFTLSQCILVWPSKPSSHWIGSARNILGACVRTLSELWAPT